MQRKAKVAKEKGSDDETEVIDDVAESKQLRQLTQDELDKIELENTPVIPDSECSPAAFIFTAHED